MTKSSRRGSALATSCLVGVNPACRWPRRRPSPVTMVAEAGGDDDGDVFPARAHRTEYAGRDSPSDAARPQKGGRRTMGRVYPTTTGWLGSGTPAVLTTSEAWIWVNGRARETAISTTAEIIAGRWDGIGKPLADTAGPRGSSAPRAGRALPGLCCFGRLAFRHCVGRCRSAQPLTGRGADRCSRHRRIHFSLQSSSSRAESTDSVCRISFARRSSLTARSSSAIR